MNMFELQFPGQSAIKYKPIKYSKYLYRVARYSIVSLVHFETATMYYPWLGL